MDWQKHVENDDSPYPEDRRARYDSGEYEITKERDGLWWLRFQKRPLGMGSRLRDAKDAAERHASGQANGSPQT